MSILFKSCHLYNSYYITAVVHCNLYSLSRIPIAMKNLFLLSLISLLACQEPDCEKGPDQTTGLALRVLDRRYSAYDQKEGDLSRSGIRISDLNQYNHVFAFCCQSHLDTIDFTQYEILGLSTVNKGSNSRYVYNVKRDDMAQKIVYTVSEEYCSRSSPIDGRPNIVVVAKLPPDYQIEYVRNQ